MPSKWRAEKLPDIAIAHAIESALYAAEVAHQHVIPGRIAFARTVREALADAGYHVVQAGTVPPWMEKVREVHERAATPDEVDDGCELGVAYDDLYRLRPLPEPVEVPDEATTTTTPP